MQQKLTNHINTKFPFLKDKKLLIAISGGVDSVVLTYLLSVLNFDISLAHCNFKLRGKESDLDEEFILKLGGKLNIKTFTTQFSTNKFAQKNKLSTQIAARELRYNWFESLVKKHQFDFVLTAHHADDNLETFLINLTRGTGLDGLTGIPEINGNVVRPLIPFSRDEIIDFAKENHIKWREDQSNASTKYIRNKIRHQVIPVLKEINPSVLETFAKTTNHLKESQQIIEDSIEKLSKEIIQKDCSTAREITKLNIDKINQLSKPKAYLYQFLKDYNFTEWNDVFKLLSAQSGKQVFSKTHILLKDRNFLILTKNGFSTEQETIVEIVENTTEITNPIDLKFETVKNPSLHSKEIIFLDKNELEFPLKLRKWKNGDVFYPSRMQGKKKISKYFKDEKFSLLDKQNTWLLCNNNDTIIWVIGHRSDNRFIAKKESNSILKISLFS